MFNQKAASRVWEGARLTPADLRAVAIPLYAILTSTTTNGTDRYTVPNNSRFIITDVLPHVAITVPSGETDGFGVWQETGAENTLFETGQAIDRIFAKAMNARCTLDMTNDALEFFIRNQFSLSDLMGAPGGEVPYLDEYYPWVLPPGTQLQFDVTLQDTAGSGTSTQYGVLLTGAMIPAEE